jgi:hypothetical protein
MGCEKAFKFFSFEPVLRVSVAGNFLKEYNYALRAVTKCEFAAKFSHGNEFS